MRDGCCVDVESGRFGNNIFAVIGRCVDFKGTFGRRAWLDATWRIDAGKLNMIWRASDSDGEVDVYEGVAGKLAPNSGTNFK